MIHITLLNCNLHFYLHLDIRASCVSVTPHVPIVSGLPSMHDSFVFLIDIHNIINFNLLLKTKNSECTIDLNFQPIC